MPNTAEMTFVTSSHLYSVYPDLTQNGKGVLIRESEASIDNGIDLKKSLYEWDLPCGVVCPSLERCWFQNKDIGWVVWNGKRVDSKTVKSLANQAFFWKIGGDCINPLCNAFVRRCD